MAFKITNNNAFFGEITPVGISLRAVRTFSESYFLSINLLKPIAALRANIMQRTTSKSNTHHELCKGYLDIAKKKPTKAKGIANIV